MKTRTIAKTMGGVLILCLGLFCTAMLWTQHQINENAQELDSPALKSAAESFGKRGNQYDCETETFRRVNSCTKSALDSDDENPEELMMNCGTTALIFQKHCLAAAKPGSGFCARSPKEATKWANWAARKCSQEGRVPSTCTNVYMQSARFCAEAASASE